MTHNNKDEIRRNNILNNSIWKVFMVLFIPLALYNLLDYLFVVFDLKIVSMLPNDPKDSIAFFDEIKKTIQAFGMGFAVGGSVIVAKLFGEGKTDEARKNAGVVLILTTIISFTIIVVTILGVVPLLKSLNFNEDIINNGQGYFYIQILTTALTSINIVFISLEKAKGNTKFILVLNVIVSFIKVGLTLLFVFVFNLTKVEWLAVTTLLAQLVLTVIAITIMFSKNNIFRIEIKDLSFNKKYIKEMIFISLPVVFGRFLFSGGRVVVNYLAASYYGGAALAALSISTTANLGFNAIASATEEVETILVSQNVGAKKIDRAFKSVFVTFMYALVISIIAYIVITIFLDPAVKFFIEMPKDTNNILLMEEYYTKVEMAKTMLKFERFALSTTAFIGVFLGGFYGFKKTRISYIANFLRTFIFRIPILIIMYYVFPSLGYKALGLTIVLSNVFTTLILFVLFIVFYIKNKKDNYVDLANTI